MGLYDRDYSRDDDYGGGLSGGYDDGYPTGRSSGRSMAVVLIFINAAVYLADALFSPGHELMYALAVRPQTLVEPWTWYQFVTAGFAHSPTDIGHIIGNMFGLWIAGQILEPKIGRREFLRFYLFSLVLANVGYAVRTYFFEPTSPGAFGASGAVVAVTVLFCLIVPQQTLLLFFVVPIKAWVLGAIVVGLDVLGALRDPPPGQPRVAHDVHLMGAAIALAYWKLGWRFSGGESGPWWSKLKRWLTRPRLKVHQPEEAAYKNLDAQGDALLDKVHREGEGSLTAEERKILEAYSRRMRQKLR